VQKGKVGEDIAVIHLKKKGYKIVERNYRCPYGEIDIIANDKGSLVFIEVKSRKTDAFGNPEAAVDIAKQKKISKVAASYLKDKKSDGHNARFDVVSVTLSPKDSHVELIKNAFDLID
jgi:putative endonuclease